MSGGIVRVNKSKDYFVASNEPFNDKRLSWDTRGMMGYLLSKPDGWEVREDDLIAQGPAGKHKIGRMMAEAKQCGYIRRYRYRKPDGTFGWITEVYESPSLNPDFKETPEPTLAELEEAFADFEFETPATTTRLSTTGLSMSGSATTGKPGHIVSTEVVSTDLTDSHSDESNGNSSDEHPAEPQQASLLTFPSLGCRSKKQKENGSQQEKAKRTGAPRTPNPNTLPIMDAYVQALGYSPANYAKESGFAKRLAAMGYTPEQVSETYRRMKTQPFWQGKFLSLCKVAEQIGEDFPPHAAKRASGETSPSSGYRFLNDETLFP